MLFFKTDKDLSSTVTYDKKDFNDIANYNDRIILLHTVESRDRPDPD